MNSLSVYQPVFKIHDHVCCLDNIDNILLIYIYVNMHINKKKIIIFFSWLIWNLFWYFICKSFKNLKSEYIFIIYGFIFTLHVVIIFFFWFLEMNLISKWIYTFRYGSFECYSRLEETSHHQLHSSPNPVPGHHGLQDSDVRFCLSKLWTLYRWAYF